MSYSHLAVTCRCGCTCEQLCIGAITPLDGTVFRCTRTHEVTESGIVFDQGCGREYLVTPRKGADPE